MFKKILSGIILIALCFMLPAGADKEKKAYELIYQDIQVLKQQILKLDKKIDSNRESIAAMQKSLAELVSLARQSQGTQANILSEQKQIPLQYQALVQKYDALSRELSQITIKLIEIQRLVTPPPDEGMEGEGEANEAPQRPGEEENAPQTEQTQEAQDTETKPPPDLAPDMDPQEVYNIARGDYMKGDFKLAIEGFSMYRDYFPESPQADNALYWIGESHFSLKEYDLAIAQFIELILNYPESDMAAAAYYKRGLCLVEQGKTEEAIDVFRLLITKYPYEEEAKSAQAKIKELGY